MLISDLWPGLDQIGGMQTLWSQGEHFFHEITSGRSIRERDDEPIGVRLHCQYAYRLVHARILPVDW